MMRVSALNQFLPCIYLLNLFYRQKNDNVWDCCWSHSTWNAVENSLHRKQMWLYDSGEIVIKIPTFNLVMIFKDIFWKISESSPVQGVLKVFYKGLWRVSWPDASCSNYHDRYTKKSKLTWPLSGDIGSYCDINVFDGEDNGDKG